MILVIGLKNADRSISSQYQDLMNVTTKPVLPYSNTTLVNADWLKAGQMVSKLIQSLCPLGCSDWKQFSTERGQTLTIQKVNLGLVIPG